MLAIGAFAATADADTTGVLLTVAARDTMGTFAAGAAPGAGDALGAGLPLPATGLTARLASPCCLAFSSRCFASTSRFFQSSIWSHLHHASPA